MLPALIQNDIIYICAPAKAIEAEHVHFAAAFFIQNGYHVEIGEHTLGTSNYFSGTVEERLSDLQKGLDHPEAKVILCARGGYGCMQLMDKLNWSEFEKNPKHFVGFSDVTALHLDLNKKNIPSLHATMPLNFKENTAESLQSLLHALRGYPSVICASKNEANQYGSASGKVVGGNLAMVHAMLSSLPAGFFKDKILFLEDVGEHLYQIDRMLYGLKYAGALDGISGLMLGSFTSMSDTNPGFGKSLEDIFRDHLSHRNIPIGFGFPCGHQNDNQAIVFGGISALQVDENGASLVQSFLENPS
jgi:muramoyltetrapeptide carboxypeptidase